MKNNLIICPVGNPLTFDSRFDSDNHWRYTNKQERDYETLVFQYSEFIPEDNTYDTLIKKRGFKWSLARMKEDEIRLPINNDEEIDFSGLIS
jgi:hypothetical protein